MKRNKLDLRDEEAIGSLIRQSGRGPQASPEARERIYSAVHAEWQRNVADRSAAGRAEEVRPGRSLLHWFGTFAKPGFAVAATAALAIVIIANLDSGPSAVTERAALLAKVSGDVRIVLPDGNDRARPAAGEALPTGTALLTGSDGGAALALPNGESLRIRFDSRVVLADAGRLDLTAGAIYLDSDSATGATDAAVISTPYGTVRHIGTQYQASVAEDNLQVSVREGAVEIAADSRALVGEAGERITVAGTGEVETTPIAATDPSWQWTEDLAALPESNGTYYLGDVLQWVARQTGRELEYATAATDRRAETLELHGVDGMSPAEVIDVMRSTTDLVYSLTATRLIVE